MADEIAKLGIEVDSKDIIKATKSLDKLERQSKDSEKQNKKLSSSFGMLKGALAGVAFGLAIRGIINTAAAFEKLEASLVTVTGSTEKAVQAMEGIKAFATETPFQVQEITDAFIKLKALGIAPTEENLRSFGNTASAMGKSLNQMIEAVADAATGEFERLKEFGIKASSQGDKVAFTFQGVTTTIGKNADEITKFLEGIGETQFAGAMEKQMDTLDGAFSNFSDTVDNAVSKLSEETGFNELIKSATLGVSSFIRQLAGTETIDDFNKKIDETRKELEKYEAIVKKYEGEDKRGLFSRMFYGDSEEILIGAQGQVTRLTKELADLQLSVSEAGKAEGGIRKAGGKTPEEKAALAQAESDKLFEIETDRLFALIDLDDQNLEQKLAFDEKMLNASQDYYSRLYDLESGSLQAGADFAKAIRDGEAKNALQNGSLMLSNLSKTNRAAFEVQKAFALANAAVTLPSAVMKSFDNGGGYPWGLIPAGLMLATGLQQINSIRSTSFGGGGTPASIGGSTSPSAPVASGLPEGSTALPDATEQSQTQITLNIDPNALLTGQVLIDTLEELGDNGMLNGVLAT